MSGLRRAALVFGILALLLLVDGIYLVATHKNPNGDTGTLFGPHGGVLDRADSALFTIVAGYYVWLGALH